MPNETDSLVLTYDTAWNLLVDRAISGQQKAMYVHGNRVDEILANIQTAKTYYPHCDALGSVIALSDDTGKKESKVTYTAYGLPINAPAKHRFLYTGREWLANIGLNEHRNRYYNPSTGRWPSTDPIGFRGGKNLYAYVENNPVDYTDPLGLFLCCDQCTAGKKKIVSASVSVVPYGMQPDSYNRVELMATGISGLDDIYSAVGLLLGTRSIKGSGNATEIFRNASEEISGNQGTSADAGFAEMFQYAGNKVLDLFGAWGGYSVYSVIKYSECESQSCFIFWSKLDWSSTKTATKTCQGGSLQGGLRYIGGSDVGGSQECLEAHMREMGF
jgi:RHS repeat-associated protein